MSMKRHAAPFSPCFSDFLLLAAVAGLMALMLVCLPSCGHTLPNACVSVVPLEGKVAYPTCATVQFAGKF